MGNRNQNRAVVYCSRKRFHWKRSVIRFDCPQFYSFQLAKVEPEEDVVRVFDLGAKHNVVARFPIEAGSEQIQALRDVLVMATSSGSAPMSLASLARHRSTEARCAALSPVPDNAPSTYARAASAEGCGMSVVSAMLRYTLSRAPGKSARTWEGSNGVIAYSGAECHRFANQKRV